MTRNFLLAGAAAVVVIAMGFQLVSAQVDKAAPMGAGFEYKMTRFEQTGGNAALNRESKDGWELVAVTSSGDREYTAFFKRRK